MSHPHDPNRWPAGEDPAPEYRDPGHAHTYPSENWNQPQPPSRRGKMPWWAWLLIGLGGFLVLILALVLWAAVAINGQTTGDTQPEPAPTAVAEPTTEPEPEPAPTEDGDASATELFREMNAEFPADHEAYLNELVDNARPVYVGSDNRVLLAMGLAVCMKLDAGESIPVVAERIPDQYTDSQSGTIIGASVKHLCPTHQSTIDEFLALTS